MWHLQQMHKDRLNRKIQIRRSISFFNIPAITATVYFPKLCYAKRTKPTRPDQQAHCSISPSASCSPTAYTLALPSFRSFDAGAAGKVPARCSIRKTLPRKKPSSVRQMASNVMRTDFKACCLLIADSKVVAMLALHWRVCPPWRRSWLDFKEASYRNVTVPALP